MDLTIEDLRREAAVFKKNGKIDFESFKIALLKDNINDVDDDVLVAKYTEYIGENDNEREYFSNDDEFFDMFFESKMDAVRSVLFGDYNLADDFVRFNGYGNLESFNEWQLIDEAKADEDFLAWLFDNYDEYDDVAELIEFINDNEEDLKGEGDE